MTFPNSNITDIPLFPHRQQIYSLKLATIEKELNFQCCQHDSLMPLLQIATYQSSLYRWEVNLKNINKKITDYESKINNIVQHESKDIYQEISQVQTVKLMNFEKIKSNVQELKDKLKQIQNKKVQRNENVNVYNNLLQSCPSNQIKKSRQLSNSVKQYKVENLELLEQSESSLRQLRKYVQMSLALFRNQVMMNQINQRNRLSKSRTLSEYSEGNQEVVQKLIYSNFHELRKEIQTIRNGVKQYDLKDFHQQTMIRLSSDLVQISQILDIISCNTSQNTEVVRVKKNEVQLIRQRLKLIYWQIKGLKKKYILKLNEMYQTEEDEYKVNTLQKTFVKDLNSIQSAYSQIKFKLDQVLNILQAKISKLAQIF